MRVAVVAHRVEPTNAQIARAWRELGLEADVLAPAAAVVALGEGDVALVRLDVLETVDGIEPGLELVPLMARAGVRVLNTPHALVGAHDKRETARRLVAAGLPHPRTGWVSDPDETLPVWPPLVLKPPFGSWGRGIERCPTEAYARARLRQLADTHWFRATGALVQELVPDTRRDARVLVAGGRIVGAVGREAAPDEWRTNTALGGHRVPIALEPAEETLALAAVEAVGIDFVGVDLLPTPGGGHVVLELNGAVDFDAVYSLPGRDVYADIAGALGLVESAAALPVS